jgi:hypothetical protein
MSASNVERREDLLDKLRNRTIRTDEAIELRGLLENEKNRAIDLGDIAAIFAVTILLGFVAEYITKGNFDLRRILGLGPPRKKRR